MMRGGRLNAVSQRMQAMIVEILIENSRGVFGGQVGQDNIYEAAHVYRFRVVPVGFLDNLCEIEGI